MNKNDAGFGVLIEQVIHQNDVILEMTDEILENLRLIPTIETKLTNQNVEIDALK